MDSAMNHTYLHQRGAGGGCGPTYRALLPRHLNNAMAFARQLRKNGGRGGETNQRASCHLTPQDGNRGWVWDGAV